MSKTKNSILLSAILPMSLAAVSFNSQGQDLDLSLANYYDVELERNGVEGQAKSYILENMYGLTIYPTASISWIDHRYTKYGLGVLATTPMPIENLKLGLSGSFFYQDLDEDYRNWNQRSDDSFWGFAPGLSAIYNVTDSVDVFAGVDYSIGFDDNTSDDGAILKTGISISF